MSKKFWALALCVVLALSLLGGCANSGSSSTPASTAPSSTAPEGSSAANGGDAPADGAAGSVYWLNFKPESDTVLQEIAEMYTAKTGVPVKVVTASAGTYNQQLTAEMDKSAPPTLFVIGNAAAARDWSDYALDLAGTPIEAELNTDAYNIYDENGKLVSIGYCYECYGIIVNLDLLNQFGSLENIKDFESLKNLVETIESKADETGIHAFTSCDMDSSSSWRFTGHMANLEYYYEQEGNVWTECPPELTGKYMENFKNLYDLAINNSITEPTELANGGHDASQEFKDGKAVFHVQGSWEYSNLAEDVPNMAMIPYYCGVEGEEKAGLNCGTENCWAINSKASPEDQQATMDFMVWCVTDPEASRMLVDSFGVMPYKNAAESTNAFLANANQYSEDGCYVMNWATNFQPNVDEYRATLVSALNAYNADQSDANWETVKTAFVQGWAVQYKAVNG